MISPINISPLSQSRQGWFNRKSVNFNGTNQIINFDSIVPTLQTHDEGTICFWVKPTDATPTGNQMLFSLGDTDANEFFYTTLLSTGQIGTLMNDAGVTQFNLKTDSVVLGDNTWSLLSFTQNATSVKIQVNGVEVAQTFANQANKTKWFNDLGTIDNCRLGSLNYNNGGDILYYDGGIDEFYIYDRALSNAELLDIYNNGVPKNESNRAGVVTYLRLGDNPLDNYNVDVANEWRFYDSLSELYADSLNMTLGSVVNFVSPSYTIYMAGQSNALGYEDMVNLQVGYQGVNTNVLMWDDTVYKYLASTTNNNQFPVVYRNNKFGCEFSLGYRLNDYLGSYINILKYTKGGSKLAIDGAALDWNIASSSELYDDFLTEISDSGNISRVKSIVWIQGENDSVLEVDALAYETNLTNFINAVRAYMGYNVHFTIVLINNNIVSTDYVAEVRAGQIATAAALQNIDTVDSDAWELQVDGVHYTAQGYDDMGGAVFNIIKDL